MRADVAGDSMPFEDKMNRASAEVVEYLYVYMHLASQMCAVSHASDLTTVNSKIIEY